MPNGIDRSDSHDRDTIRPHCVQGLGKIMAEVRPKIVLSSSWRYLVYGGTISTLGFEYLLRTHGLPAIADQIIGPTIPDEKCAHCGDHRPDGHAGTAGRGANRTLSGSGWIPSPSPMRQPKWICWDVARSLRTVW